MGLSVKVAPGARYYSSRGTGCLATFLGLLAVMAVISLLWNYWFIVVPALTVLCGLLVAARQRAKRR